MLDLTVSTDMAAVANARRWFEHMIRTEDNPVRIALIFEGRQKERAKEHMEVKDIL